MNSEPTPHLEPLGCDFVADANITLDGMERRVRYYQTSLDKPLDARYWRALFAGNQTATGIILEDRTLIWSEDCKSTMRLREACDMSRDLYTSFDTKVGQVQGVSGLQRLLRIRADGHRPAYEANMTEFLLALYDAGVDQSTVLELNIEQVDLGGRQSSVNIARDVTLDSYAAAYGRRPDGK